MTTEAPHTPPEEFDALVRESVDKVRQAVALRDQLHIRVGGRVTSIIRVQMITLAVASVGMTLLIGVLAWHFRYMVEAMETMNRHFRVMSEDMTVMRQVIDRMDRHVKGMPAIAGNVQEMDAVVGSMTRDLDTIAASMDAMNLDIRSVQYNVVRMTNTFNAMDWAVFGIGQDVNAMSAPMKDFNTMRSFMPLP